MQETTWKGGDLGLIPGSDQEDPLEKVTATHSSILAWKIPWTEVASWLQSMDMTCHQKSQHDIVTNQQQIRKY